MANAGWHPDPSGRYELRYHNGARWTGDVATNGRRYVDATPASDGGPTLDPPPRSGGALRNRVATASMVLGIVAVAVGWLPVVAVVGLVAAMVALVLGLIGRRRARAGAGGAGFATAGIALGAIGMVVGAVGIVITVVLVGAVERYEDPAANTTTVTSCEVDGRRLEATGTLTNDGDRAASFTVRVELEGDRAEHATRRERLAEVDDVAPGASATWSAGLLLGDRSPPSDPVCSVVAVHGPLPFGIDPGP